MIPAALQRGLSGRTTEPPRRGGRALGWAPGVRLIRRPCGQHLRRGQGHHRLPTVAEGE
jgi:hypothetical protein